jgi:translocation and assembly module TamB
MRDRKRKLLRYVLYVVLGGVLLIVLLPVWLPWALRPVAKNFGFKFQEYHRDSYRRFTATELSYSNANVRFSVDKVSASIPIFGKTDFVDIANWRLEFSPKKTARQTQKAPSVHRIFRQTERIVPKVLERVPRGSATNGVISWPGQALGVPSLSVFPDRIAATVEWSNQLARLELALGEPHQIQIAVPSTNLLLNIAAHADASMLRVSSTNRWLTNDFVLNAQFGPEALLPDIATLHARSPMPAVLDVEWQTNRFTLSASGKIPVKTNTVSFEVSAHGNTNSAVVDHVSATGLGVQLTNAGPVMITYAQPYISEALFRARVDLDQQSFIPAQGELHGEVTLLGTSNRFELRGQNLQLAKQTIDEFALKGSLAWPHLDGSLTAKSEKGELAARFKGPITNLAHSGEAHLAPLALPHMKPATVHASWSGTHLEFETILVKVSAGTALLDLAAKGDKDSLIVSKLTLEEGDKTHLRLDSPFRLSREGIQEFKVSGDSLTASFSGERTHGAASLRVENSDLGFLNSFTTLSVSNVFIDKAAFSGAWDRGPLKFDLSLNAQWNRIPFQAQAAGDAAGVRITTLKSGFGSLDAAIPVSIEPAAQEFLHLRQDDPVRVSAMADEQSQLWTLLTNRFGVLIRRADARAEVGGTLRDPIAQVNLIMEELRFREAPPEVPSFKDLALSGHVSGRTALVERLVFAVAGQPVTFTGQVPLSRLDWRVATARLQIDRASLAPFTPLVRGYLSPEGLLRADVQLVPGGKLNGQIVIDGASTRPLANLGAIRDLELICNFSEQHAKVKSVGSLGGETLFAVGQVELGPEQWLKGKLPPFELQLHGENLPLSRQVDALIRADINATLRSQSNAPTVVTGTINLRNSLFLRDLRDLIPGSVSSPAQRPPYFSVENEPFAQWRLDLDVIGKKFLRVRTPLFQGEASADLQLSGTLKDPLAVGDISLDSGTIRLPFATLRVTQGFVTLSSENPYRPQLFVNAADRAFGYDVKMSVTGPVDAPVIQFSSPPPLSSEQVLLMLTAGEMPRQNTFSFSAQQRAQRLGLFLGRGLMSQFGFGGDASRLTIKSGENISETGRPTYSVEYELTDDWAVIGQYDQFNDFNLMLKWQVYAR